jgi:hypothetical protein
MIGKKRIVLPLAPAPRISSVGLSNMLAPSNPNLQPLEKRHLIALISLRVRDTRWRVQSATHIPCRPDFLGCRSIAALAA